MTDLFAIAEQEDVDVLYSDIPHCESMSMDGYIALDYSLIWNTSEERVHLAHELGHCVTGSFYNRYSPFDVRAQHENRATHWAIRKIIPLHELNNAVHKGYTEPWELAEYFNVTEPFIIKAVQYYKEATL